MTLTKASEQLKPKTVDEKILGYLRRAGAIMGYEKGDQINILRVGQEIEIAKMIQIEENHANQKRQKED